MPSKQYTTPHGTAVVEKTATPGVRRVWGADGEMIGHVTRLDASAYEVRATQSQLTETFGGSMIGEGVAWLTKRYAIWSAS